MKSRLHIIGAGGAGINISVEAYEKLKNIADTTCEFDLYLLDTTDKTINRYPNHKDRFHKITSKRLTSKGLDGTGSERKNTELVSDMMESIKVFLDSGLDNNVNDFYVIISSGSGGSGSIINPLLTKLMLERDYCVSNIIVGDSSNLLSLENTINTIASLDAIARQTKTALNVNFYNNSVEGITTPSSEKANNRKIYKLLGVLSIFNSGTNYNLDNEDMRKFYNPTRYKTFSVKPGLYSLGISEKELTDEKAILARTLVSEKGEDVEVYVKLLHNKTGVISPENEPMLANYPTYLTCRKDVMAEVLKELKEEHKAMNDIKNPETGIIESLDNSLSDDTGLIL